ncbi:Swt1 family HEPN domain-containing protein [Spirosoma montaniterrae]|uniref:Swt1-like HEPN domain-containing protein n=1 Tax=Spirosoma montaniterrae TaxID=1178516 RepID=A0A1P9WV13_9BACT|nr:Swt1 family HEPN domain-containing protein [Spirosoma montaniterrae]AQG79217.1 hypothetical protein AWR27_07690 [Spirosoma montaniterrae]
MNTDPIYNFAFRGLLTLNALEKTSCIRKRTFTAQEGQEIINSLGINELDEDLVKTARKMAIVYTGVSAFENTVRKFVANVLLENHGENWWELKVMEGIKKKAESRRLEESKIRWHTPRGDSIINYTEFGDLFIIIKNNWIDFQPYIISQEWAEQIIRTIERSRNVIMHSGELVDQDIERIGMFIRDWIKQVGA